MIKIKNIEQIKSDSIKAFGFNSQLVIIAEELNELSKEVLKILRYREINKKIDENIDSMYKLDLIDEFADVTIVLNQLESMLNENDIKQYEERVNFKLKRHIRNCKIKLMFDQYDDSNKKSNQINKSEENNY